MKGLRRHDVRKYLDLSAHHGGGAARTEASPIGNISTFPHIKAARPQEWSKFKRKGAVSDRYGGSIHTAITQIATAHRTDVFV